MEFAEYLATQDEREKELKELISELETMTLEDFKFLDNVDTDRYEGNGIIYGAKGDGFCISFYYDKSCYAFVKLGDDPEDPSDLWDDDIYDEEFTELKEMALEALKEEL